MRIWNFQAETSRKRRRKYRKTSRETEKKSIKAQDVIFRDRPKLLKTEKRTRWRGALEGREESDLMDSLRVIFDMLSLVWVLSQTNSFKRLWSRHERQLLAFLFCCLFWETCWKREASLRSLCCRVWIVYPFRQQIWNPDTFWSNIMSAPHLCLPALISFCSLSCFS